MIVPEVTTAVEIGTAWADRAAPAVLANGPWVNAHPPPAAPADTAATTATVTLRAPISPNP